MESGLVAPNTATSFALRKKAAVLSSLSTLDILPEDTKQNLLRSSTAILPNMPRTLSLIGDPRDKTCQQLLRQATLTALANMKKPSNRQADKAMDNFIDVLTAPVLNLSTPAVRIYYVTDWHTPFIHYRHLNSDEWTKSPGQLLLKCDTTNPEDRPEIDIPKGFNLWYITLLECEGLEFVPNDMGKAWDNPPGGANYRIEGPGGYLLRNGHIKPLLPVPLRPLMLLSTNIGVNSVTIRWNPPMDGEINIEGYNIYRNRKKIGNVLVENMEADRQYEDNTVFGATTYIYSVCAYNANEEEGPHCTPLEVKTGDPERPGSVDSLSLVCVSSNSLKLKWQPPIDNGGGLIRGYRILRDGVPITTIDVSEDQTQDEYVYLDDGLEKSKWYCYHITAFFNNDGLQSAITYSPTPIPTTDDMTDEAIDNIQQNILKSYKISKGESMLGPPILGFTRATVPAPRLFERNPHIILQSFNWASAANRNCWYKVLAGKVDTMKQMGITIAWLPPPSKSVAIQGYMPSELYELNSAYGSEQQLRSLLRSMHDVSISPMLDLVVNHRCGSKQDQYGQWTMFENPSWGPWAIVKNNKQGYHNVSNQNDTGAQSDCAPDLNHNNPTVKNDLKKWIRWLHEDVGFNTIRIDMAPGYGTNHQLDYVGSMNIPLAVAEYWSGDSNVLRNYCEKAQRKIAAFDFAFYYVLRRSVESENYNEMNNNGRLNGLVGRDPGLSVTFLDNHDTVHLSFVGRFGQGDFNKILRGYSVLLTHPGTPTIFWDHFSDYGDMTNKLTQLCQIRHRSRVHSLSRIEIKRSEYNLYATITHGDHNRIALRLGYNDWHPGHGYKQEFSSDGICIWISCL